MFTPTTEIGKLWTTKNLEPLRRNWIKALKPKPTSISFPGWMLTKLTVEIAPNAELTNHLEHEKNAPKTGTNTCNGYSSKTLLCDDGEIELNTSRDRENTL